MRFTKLFLLVLALLIVINGCTKDCMLGECNKDCKEDSDCKHECACGCINEEYNCAELALCNMPPGSCKCINSQCEFVVDEEFRTR